MFLANLEVAQDFQLIHPCNLHGFVDFLLLWNDQSVGGNGSKTPEVDEGGNSRVESAAGLSVCPLCVLEQFMKAGWNGNRFGRKGCV